MFSINVPSNLRLVNASVVPNSLNASADLESQQLMAKIEATIKRKPLDDYWNFGCCLVPKICSSRVAADTEDMTEVVNKMKTKHLLVQEELSSSIGRHQEQASRIRNLEAINNHEMTTAIMGMVAQAEILKEEGSSLSEKEKEDIVVSISDSGRHLMLVLNNRHDYEKAKKGTLEILPRSFNIQEHLHSILSNYSKEINKPNIDFSSFIDHDIPNFVIGDKSRISQILDHILSIVIKLTDVGNVDVSVNAEKNVAGNDSDININFKISAAGQGITQEIVDRLLNPDKQKAKEDGTSVDLRLVVAKSLIELMEGEMLPVVTSSEDLASTTFIFNIKVKKQPIEESVLQKTAVAYEKINPSSLEDRLKGKKVLSVDDSKVNRKFLEHRLAKLGMKCTSCENGLEAVNMLRADPSYDLVLMDLDMPVMNGIKATEEIRNTLKLYNLPILALTAGTESSRDSCIAVGMNDYMNKTEIGEKLVCKMDELIQNSKEVRRASIA